MTKIAYAAAGLAAGVLLTSLAFAAQETYEDPVKQSPQFYKVLIDNDQVRVLEYRLKPGETEPMHRHPAGVVHYFSDARFLSSSPGGKAVEATVKAGDTVWRDETTHAAVNIGDTEAHGIAVELKQSAGAARR